MEAPGRGETARKKVFLTPGVLFLSTALTRTPSQDHPYPRLQGELGNTASLRVSAAKDLGTPSLSGNQCPSTKKVSSLVIYCA